MDAALDPELTDYAELANGVRDGWVQAMGVRFLRVTRAEVVAELVVGPEHLQPYGLVHGGVHAGLVETVASVGAGVQALLRGWSAVGLENHTTFLHAVREGRLRATGRPLSDGSRTQVWGVDITDAAGRLVASGRVRMMLLPPGTAVAGETVAVKV